MTTKLQTLHMTPAELAVNERIEADIKAGVDPFGEEDDDPQDTDLPVDETPPVNTTAEATPPVAETPPAAATTETPPAATAEATPPATTTETPPPATAEAVPEDFGVAPDLSDLKGLVLPAIPQVDVTAFQTARTDLNAQIAAIEAKFEDGTLSPQERDAQRAPLVDQLDDLKQQHAIEIAEQRATARLSQATQEQVLGRLRAAGARDGLDYGQPGAETTVHATQFDMVTRALYADPKNKTKTWVEMAALADSQVRAMNSIAPKAASPAPAPAGSPTTTALAAPKPPVAVKAPVAARAAPPTPPQTLRELPAAARSSEASETIAGKLAAANAHGKDALWNKMTRAQQLAILGED